MLAYSYDVGVFSSRKIAVACERNRDFLVIVGIDRSDFRTISDFRQHHQAAMKPLFLEVLRVAGELGLVKLGNLSTDGTKIEANASRHKAMSFGYMRKELERLKAEIDQLLASANGTVAEQDAALGSRRGAELPAELQRRAAPLADPFAGAAVAVSETPKAAMSRKLRTESGRQLYAARKRIVEPGFGQIKHLFYCA